ncbi:hypothetical protein CAPTEDRAFT_163986 [Capitella teleta]|uniref:Peptide-N-glycosidase F N-terminal domain-containing protein n=1 Tax=Capitella teleta TaxID=283909 RepID=R7V4L6_CAPTE|nr:hypothetical protein CAPTEDRAFT_163986 [Capitella teleta]|eukprot:ELU13514.1 hypothetical protein CAPTEDRAFT_163986 [Capitella teleta]
MNRSTPVVFFSHHPLSAFSRCLWRCDDSIADLLLNTPNETHYIISMWNTEKTDWTINDLERMSLNESKAIWSRFHFAERPTQSLTKWIPDLLFDWRCEDHNCGIDELWISLSSHSSSLNFTSMRLDARYDWLPSPVSTFGSKFLPVSSVSDPCVKPSVVKGTVAIVTYDSSTNCSYHAMISSLAMAGARAAIIMQKFPEFPVDMNCHGNECSRPINIPATNIPFQPELHNWFAKKGNITIQFRNQQSPNFFFAIDHHGNLAEVGWFLYPTMHFLAWQAQWFSYYSSLEQRLNQPSYSFKVFENVAMNGSSGFTANVSIPKDLSKFTAMDLDFSLSCFGFQDEECPHWDRTVQLHVCCDWSSALCGAELGRWISPFRRRIGRWLTNATTFIPLISNPSSSSSSSSSSQKCSFHLSGILNGEVWKPSLNLRFRRAKVQPANYKPFSIQMLYNGSHAFDCKYNRHFSNHTLTFPPKVTKVELVSVITGHGSDENGCGEFCVTSHHFTVNQRTFSRTFDNAGTPFGCARRVASGVEPNEHGTWLYGRNGWCDGQQVDPWVINITNELNLLSSNVIGYYGWFNGTDPDPKQSPGIIIIYTYLVIYI